MKKLPAVLSITFILLLSAAATPAHAAASGKAPAKGSALIVTIAAWLIGGVTGTSGLWSFPNNELWSFPNNE